MLASLLPILQFGCGSGSSAADKKDDKFLIGTISWEEWQSRAGWDDYSASDYEPAPETLRKLKSLIRNKDYMFLIFSGYWCSDSKSEVPKIFKLLNMCGVPANRIKLIGLDRQKSEPSGIAKEYSITKVPTLIILTDDEVSSRAITIPAGQTKPIPTPGINSEAGRIIEYPSKSWDEDILSIIFEK
ncbi:MAG: hypothetical protein QG635_1131 [Bacteroidota bacterium]|nr:hypothetical protein [Bacteroidota bacterium]